VFSVVPEIDIATISIPVRLRRAPLQSADLDVHTKVWVSYDA